MALTAPDPIDYAAPPAVAVDRKPAWKTVLVRLGPFLGLAFVLALFSALRPKTFMTVGNAQEMLVLTAVVGTGALGMTIIIISGGIDLSAGSNVALVTIVVAMMLNKGASPLVAAAVGVGAAMLCGLLIGSLVAGIKLSPFIVTLGLMGAIRGAAEGLGSESTVYAPQSWLNNLLQPVTSGQKWMIFPLGIWLLVGMTVLVTGVLRYTRFGRHIFAVGSNPQTARLCGVAVNRTTILVYLFGTLLIGLAGILQYSYLTVGDPTTAVGMELSMIAAVVIGGASLSGGEGSALGTIIGALIMTAIASGCAKLLMPNWVQLIVTGGIIILAVSIDSLRHRRRG